MADEFTSPWEGQPQLPSTSSGAGPSLEGTGSTTDDFETPGSGVALQSTTTAPAAAETTEPSDPSFLDGEAPGDNGDESDPDESEAGELIADDELSKEELVERAKDMGVFWDKFPLFKTIFKVDDVQFSSDMGPGNLLTPTCTISFRTPTNQRSMIVVRLVFALKSAKSNKGPTSHSIFLYVPAMNIDRLKLLPHESSQVSSGFRIGSGFEDANGNAFDLARVTVETRRTYLRGRIIPELMGNMTAEAQALVDSISTDQPMRLTFLIRDHNDNVKQYYDKFRARMMRERRVDPTKAWVKDAPNTNSLMPGNVHDLYDRPDIANQPAQILFLDKLDLQVALTYGTIYEDEYQEMLTNELTQAPYQMTVIEAPMAFKTEATTTTDPPMSSATLFFGFIAFTDTNLQRPNAGERLKIAIKLPQLSTEPLVEAGDDVTAGVANGATSGAGATQDTGAGQDTGAAQETDEDADLGADEHRAPQYNPVAELGDDDNVDMLDDENGEGLTDEDGPNVWTATVMEPFLLTPPGFITVFLQRRREPNWTGTQKDRPFVDLKLPIVNFDPSHALEDPSSIVTSGPKIDIGIGQIYSKQNLKDMLRCGDQLFRSILPQQQRLVDTLLMHNPDKPPLHHVDLLSMMKRTHLVKTFNPAQQNFYDSLKHTPELTLLQGPYGTGKTETCVRITAQFASEDQQVLYLVETNKAVDEVALRIKAISDEEKLGLLILRLHSFPGEKKAIYTEFGDPKLNDAPSRIDPEWIVSDATLAEYTLVTCLQDFGARCTAVLKHVDPRRVVLDLALSKATADYIKTSKSEAIQRLKTMLQAYAIDGLNTDPAERTAIKLGLNDVMMEVVRKQMVIVATVAVSAKVNLAQNFHPKLVILDEAARIPELRALMPFGQFSPNVFLWVGDHVQQLPFVSSHGREKDTIPFINPFSSQQRLSGFGRLSRGGLKTEFLHIQQRCTGEIPAFADQQFYDNRIQQAPESPESQQITATMRGFCREELGTQVSTNRYARNIQDSRSEKESAGTSQWNRIEADALCDDLYTMTSNNDFKGRSIAVLSFYKAQLNYIRERLTRLPLRNTIKFVNCAALTVATAQGTEYDIVLLSLVQTSHPTFINEPHALVVALTRAKFLFGIYTNWRLVDEYKMNSNNVFIHNLLHDLAAKKHVIDSGTKPIQKPCLNCGQFGHRQQNCEHEHADVCVRCVDNLDFDNMLGHLKEDCTHYDKPKFCRRCKDNDRRQDPEPHETNDCPYYPRPPAAPRTCNNCDHPGHEKRYCPRITCNKCSERGHTRQDCPQPDQCLECRQVGHLRRECPNKKRTRAQVREVKDRLAAQKAGRVNAQVTPGDAAAWTPGPGTEGRGLGGDDSAGGGEATKEGTNNGWGQWTRADAFSIGMDRTVKNGTGNAGLY